MILVKVPLPLLLSFLFTVVGILEILGAHPKEGSPGAVLDQECSQHERCDQCIQTPSCWWCKDKSWSLDAVRCFSNLSRTIECADIENPQGVLKENPDGSEVKENHQIHPQVVQLNLRKGKKMNISIQYTDKKNRPLDLYIIMDLSCSMKPHKDKVANLAKTLANNLQNLTNDLKIGFGSFVDKPLAPFGFVHSSTSETGNCTGEKVGLPYGFQNHLKLTADITQFINGVKSAGISFNIDSPEGTLDGLLQSIVCKEQIGWRTGIDSRKLVVISTDGPFHLAGDGKKLVNTTTLLSENTYKDFVNINFFVRCPGKSHYVSGNQCNQVGPGVNVSFKVEVELKDCPSNSDLWKSDIKIYPQSSNDDYLTINLMMLCGCNCDSSNKPLVPPNQASCSNHGDIRCGACHCEEKWGGPFCNCTVNDGGLVDRRQCVDPKAGLVCNDRGECDSCGKCKCNPKDGNPNAYSGKYCECDNTNCLREDSDSGLCNEKGENGPHGHCSFGECICKPGKYTGKRCECPVGDESCLDNSKSPGRSCNGLGTCQCGKCVCDESYKGEFCEIQHARVNGSCEHAKMETEACVKCLVSLNSEGETDEAKRKRCSGECSRTKIDFKQRIDQIPVHEQELVCEGTEENAKGCRVDFIIREMNIHDGTIKLEIESGEAVLREKCPVPAPIFEIVIGIVAAMVLIGILLLLVWKVVTHRHDRQEYEKFEKLVKVADWSKMDNPIYQPSTSQFENPAYLDYQETEIN